jgi:LmbE family N-acetylglucosaminyl deacetylase
MLDQKNCGTESKSILATGAHFDDAEVGIGGTLLKHIARGDRVKIAILSADEFRTGDPDVRRLEQANSINKMGLRPKDLILFSMDTDRAEIISRLDNMKADIIYTPYGNDTHQDHRRCSKIAQSVGRKRDITTIFYYCGSSIEFNPNLFSFFDFNKKIELINCYKTQIECGALKLDRREKMESYWASLVSEDVDSYAEGLIVRKMIYEV